MSIFSDKFDQLKKADKAVKSPKYLQEVMGIGRIAENGIFEVGKGIYSRTYRFLDIYYVKFFDEMTGVIVIGKCH